MALKASFAGELAGASSFLDSGSRGASFRHRKGWIFGFLFCLDSVCLFFAVSACERFLLLSGSGSPALGSFLFLLISCHSDGFLLLFFLY
jgi:hypothetical protein